MRNVYLKSIIMLFEKFGSNNYINTCIVIRKRLLVDKSLWLFGFILDIAIDFILRVFIKLHIPYLHILLLYIIINATIEPPLTFSLDISYEFILHVFVITYTFLILRMLLSLVFNKLIRMTEFELSFTSVGFCDHLVEDR